MLLCGAAASARPQISLCADVWCPYNCAPGSAQPGFAVEIAREVFARAGYTVTYQAAGWPRCIEDARAGRYTAIIGAGHDDAPDFTFPQLPIGNSRIVFAVRRGDPFRYAGPRSFEGRVIASTGGYTFHGETGAYITAHADDSRYVELISGEDALQKNLAKLLAGHVDVVVDDGNVLRNTLATLGLQDKVSLVQGPTTAPFFIAFSPASPDRENLACLLDRGIAQMRASGTLAAVLARYHVRDGS